MENSFTHYRLNNSQLRALCLSIFCFLASVAEIYGQGPPDYKSKRFEQTWFFHSAGLSQGKEILAHFIDAYNPIISGNNYYLGMRYLNLNSNLDTSRFAYFMRSEYFLTRPLAYNNGFHYFSRILPSRRFPQDIVPMGRAGLVKFNDKGQKKWDFNISPGSVAGNDLLGNGIVSSFQGKPNEIFVMGNRTYTGGAPSRMHPFIMVFDTLGFKVRELDILVRDSTVGYQMVQLANDRIGVLGTQYTVDSNAAVMWIIQSNPLRLVSQEFIGISEIQNRDYYTKVAVGPNDKYFFYRQAFAQPANIANTTTAQMRASLNGTPIWTITGDYVNFATFLENGNLLIQTTTLNNFELHEIDPNTGFSTSSNVFPAIETVPATGKNWGFQFPILSDSGNFYCAANYVATNTVNRYCRLYCVKAIGKTYKPWVFTTSISDLISTEGIHLYPNPTRGMIKIKFSSESVVSIARIFNNSGKEVWRGAPSSDGEIDISGLMPGLYHVEALTNSGRRWATRVVKE